MITDENQLPCCKCGAADHTGRGCNAASSAPQERATDSLDASRRNLVTRALEFAAHGHGDLPSGFMSDAVDCLTGVLRDNEESVLAIAAEARANLRDRFAMSALQALSSAHDDGSGRCQPFWQLPYVEQAAGAYALADAMLNARKPKVAS